VGGKLDDVRALIAEMAPVRGAEVSGSSDLRVDLGYDSLTLMELAAVLEERFDLGDVPEEDAAEADTVAEVEQLVSRLLAEKAS
jgi:acyl carrier protein